MNRKERDKAPIPESKKIQLNAEQKEAKQYIIDNEPAYSFLVGKAGTSKTFTAVSIALDMVFKKIKSKIVITRPTVATEENGFLPGTLEEKMEPWLVPIRDNMMKIVGKEDKLRQMEEKGIIEIVPMSFFRGRTFSDSVCILDEIQNMTVSQLKMSLGRLGKDSIMIFCGDTDQIDLKHKEDSALEVLDYLCQSEHVYIQEMLINHRHPAVEDVFNKLENKDTMEKRSKFETWQQFKARTKQPTTEIISEVEKDVTIQLETEKDVKEVEELTGLNVIDELGLDGKIIEPDVIEEIPTKKSKKK